MRSWGVRALIGLALTVLPVFADPADFTLFQWIFNVNGTIYDSAGIEGSATLPGNFSAVSGSPLSGLGVLSVEFGAPGTYDFIAFFDQEIREALNGFSNETAAAVGTAPAGLSFETGEPGFTTAGEVFYNTLGGALGNAIGPSPDDVAMALGWNFTLAAGETATILLSLSETAPAGGFYLQQTDPDDGGAAGMGTRNLYYSTSLSITGTGTPEIPEPGYYAVLAIGLLGLGVIAHRRRRASGQTTS